jgi:predicted nucleotidyltransferase
MPSITQKLEKKGLISPPRWLATNVQYEALIGSVAYGASSDTSDMDIYGWTIPTKQIVFPHLAGVIPGFGNQGEKFDQFQRHGIVSEDELGGKGRQYDIQIYSIIKYFSLCTDCNPSVMDSLYTPLECILHSTQVGNLVRENRKLFLSKRCWPRYKGYAYSQLNKMSSKEPIGKRKETVERYGFDVKFGMHVCRLLDYVEQLLTIGDIDMRRNKEQFKAIRRGEMTETEVREWAASKEKQLEQLFGDSKLPDNPDEAAIKNLLLQCLEEHYGSLQNCIEQTGWEKVALQEIDAVLHKHRKQIYGN